VLAAFLLACPARAWVDRTQSFAAVKTATPPALDASLTDPVWQTGLKMTDFFNYTTRQPAKNATVAYLLYDDKNLYVGIHCAQAGTAIVAAQTVDHSGVSTDDHVAFQIDTAGNGSRTYEFRANPKGIHDEYSSENARYAPDWTSIAKIFPNGDYNIMMVIPLSDIRAESTPVQRWRLDVARLVAATNDEYTWAYDPTQTSIDNSGNWPFLTGIQIAARATRPRPHADVYGLASAGSDRRLFQNGIGQFQDNTPRSVGVDLTYPITNSLAFVGTLNPDFSNVEQDQTTIAPQEFQRQYSEYRPFFSQGAQYINSLPGVNVNASDIPFYTPAIGIFNHGEKIEGTIGRNSIGLLNVGGNGFDDAAMGYSYQTTDQSFDAGLEAVDANFIDPNTGNRVHDDVRGYALVSENPHSGVLAVVKLQTDTGSFVTDAAQAQDLNIAGGWQGAKGLVLAAYRDIGPEYAPALGFITNNDIRGPQLFGQYNGVGPKNGFVKSYSVLGGIDRFVDRSGAAHQVDTFENYSVTFKNSISATYGNTTSELGFYNVAAFPLYIGRQYLPFNSQGFGLDYKDGTPSPIDTSYTWGPYGGVFLQQMVVSTSQQFGVYGASLDYEATIEKSMPESFPGTPALDSQWLRRVSLTRSFGKNASFALGLRSINGNGGFALPGSTLALSYHQRFRNLDELFVDYGSPAYFQTLHRLVVKFVFHTGGGTGS